MMFAMLWAVIPHKVWGDDGDGDADLSVFCYNVQFLPPPIGIFNKRKQPTYRADRIAEESATFDIVGLQETFHPTYRQRIIDRLSEMWEQEANLLIAPNPDGFRTNGGTLLATRRPIAKTSSVVFKNFSRPEDYGLTADGHAAKGVIHARLAKSASEPDKTVDVYVTHLEARADKLRPKQYAEMAAFIKQTSDPNSPMILMGDMNTRGMVEHRQDPESQYTKLLAALNGARPNGGVTDVWPLLMGDALGGTSDQDSIETGKRIDYIFVGNPEQATDKLVPKSIEVRTYQDAKVVALSDHNAVIAHFDWKD